MLEERAGQRHLLCGLDEVGRGALAGPLVAAAVILPRDARLRLGELAPLLRDSKTLSRLQRERIAPALRRDALDWRVVAVSVPEIEARGIGWANREAFRRLIFEMEASEYVVDGNLRLVELGERASRVRCQTGADSSVPAVAAASILAKVWRDDLMRVLDASHPGYGWARNVGYGTAAHIAALRELGPSLEHRSRFVATALGKPLSEQGR